MPEHVLTYKNRAYHVLVDLQDQDLFLKHDWVVREKTYISYLETFTRKPNGKFGGVGLHRLILGTKDPGIKVDHINGNGLDNRRVNLRECSTQQLALGRAPSKENKTGYKGVSKDRSKFRAHITVNGKRVHLGTFSTPEEAALAYDASARIHYGPFAKLNFELWYNF